MYILGITFGHDAAACLLRDGTIIADAAEERFSRIKHYAGFPIDAIEYCLSAAGIQSQQVDIVALAGAYPPAGSERFFALSSEQRATLAALRPMQARARHLLLSGGQSALPLYIRKLELGGHCRLVAVDHHLAHAAAAYHTRGRNDECLICTMDGIGDDISIAFWHGQGNEINCLKSWGRDASLGWFYGSVTEALGWQHGDGEGKTMGLAPYGDPNRLREAMQPLCPDFETGELKTPHDFGQPTFLNIGGSYHWHFDGANIIRDMVKNGGPEHVAAAAQDILERQAIGLVRHWLNATGLKRLACSGGVFQNVKLNQRIWYGLELEEHWVFPNPGDAGLAMGAALRAWHDLTQPETYRPLHSLSLGPSYSTDEIRALLDARKLPYQIVSDPSLHAAKLLADNQIVGWFQGRAESGPRALGNRSILMSPSRAENKQLLNDRVKFREEFRPFCPSLLADKIDDYLLDARHERFMITSFNVRAHVRDRILAVVHVDGTARPQSVMRQDNPLFYDLIRHFGRISGDPVVLNTSFNIKGEPIVTSPREALRCYFDTGLDALVMGPCVLHKKDS